MTEAELQTLMASMGAVGVVSGLALGLGIWFAYSVLELLTAYLTRRYLNRSKRGAGRVAM